MARVRSDLHESGVWNAGQSYLCHGVYILLLRQIYADDPTCTTSFVLLSNLNDGPAALLVAKLPH